MTLLICAGCKLPLAFTTNDTILAGNIEIKLTKEVPIKCRSCGKERVWRPLPVREITEIDLVETSVTPNRVEIAGNLSLDEFKRVWRYTKEFGT